MERHWFSLCLPFVLAHICEKPGPCLMHDRVFRQAEGRDSSRLLLMREARSLPPLMKSARNTYPRKGGRVLIS